MCSIFLRVIILILFFHHTVAEKRCDNSICNHEAVCILKDDKPTCDCVQKIFEGKFCSKLTDHCTSNPCQNAGTCHTYPGHYNCECPAGFSGQKCTSKQVAPIGFHLHYNRLAPIGKEQSLLIMFQTLGEVESLIEFFTSDYIIDGGGFTSTSGFFKSSNNLEALSKQLGLRHSDELPYNKGYYRISRATFWKLGVHTMTVDLSDFGITAENFFNDDFHLYVYDPSQNRCLPVIHLLDCENPRKALHIDIVTFNFVEPIVDKRCREDTHIRIKWSVRNYVNSVVLHKFEEDASTVLTIWPYTMWFNFRDDYVQSYLILGDVNELTPGGGLVSNTVLRCYVFVDSKPTTAHILGGASRDVKVGKAFVIDGTYSRDYARRSHLDQKLEYSWSCVSEDSENTYCVKKMGTASRLSIPAHAFKLDQTYKFTLRVRSTINIYSTSSYSQEIKVVSEDPLLLHFHCLRNCEQDKFAAGKIIHLKIDCIDCPAGYVAYIVRNEQGAEVATSHSVILTEESKKEVSLKAEASIGSRFKGTTSIKLTLNSPPAKGSCKISPTSGVEYQTIFEISCPGYQDDDKPIDYKYTAGNTTLSHTGNNTLSTRLFPTSGQRCEIKISICDDIGACTEAQVQASLTPISPESGSWLEFLSQNGTNLKELIEDGDRSAAIVLIRTTIPHMPADENFKIAKHIVESLRDLELGRLLVVEQVLTVGSDLFEALELSSDSAVLISEVFAKVADGLLHSIRNGEVNELPLEAHEQMISNLAQSMSKATTEVEEFPMVHDAEPIPPDDPFSESYGDYGELNVEDVVHISNWLQSFTQMHNCLQIMGVASAFVQLPDETAVIIEMKGITSKTLVIDKYESVALSFNETNTFVSLPDDFLKSLNGKEIAIQVSIFEANPFWWNPEQYKINTEVISVGAYTKDLKSLKPSSTKVSFSFYMALKGSIDEGNATQGTVNCSLDMPVYEKVLPAHAVLVVTFTPPDEDIQVLLKLDKRPRSYMLQQAQKVRSTDDNSTLFLINHHSHERKAFLAIASESRTNFSFSMYARLCLTWNSRTYEWTSEYCSVGKQTNATHIQCSCWHLSMFGAKVHPTFGNLQLSRGILKDLAPNYAMTAFYLIILVLLCLLLLVTWRQVMTAADGLVVLNNKPGRNARHQYVITIYTNGHANAATTSNVTIQLHGSISDSQQYTLYSSRRHTLFRRNVPTSFAIHLETPLGVLESISLHHDSFGRYPTWNCHAIRVRDEVDKYEYIFFVNKWLSNYESTTCTAVAQLATKQDIERRKQVFRDTLTDAFANWFAQQAIYPTRVCGSLTVMEKTAIFILRVCITLVGTIMVFGPTTMFTYEDEREIYYSMLLGFGKLLLIAFCCHLVGCFAAAGLQYLFIDLLRPRQKNVRYTLMFDE